MPNYILLEKITVGSAGASSVTFSGIPQTGYTDLVIKGSSRRLTDSANNDAIGIRFNGSSSDIYSQRNLSGNGSSAASSTAAGVSAIYGYGSNNPAGATASTFSNFEAYIPNYTGSNQKSVSLDGVTENNATTAYAVLTAGISTTTDAISSITIIALSSGTFAANSTFYLYGVAKLGTTPAIVPYATGGDTIMTDGTYWYHAFKSSGTFTPAKGLTCDYLVVAGGGGGGTPLAGGGGAGGLRSTVTTTGGGGSLESALSLASGTGYTVTIGAGGAVNANGSNSVFSSITSTGGGRGGYYNVTTGAVGGSGGGGGGGDGILAGGAGTANQGYAGGSGNDGAPTYVTRVGGGGGGAGAVGANGVSSVNGGNGGAGVQITALATPTQTGVSGYYAGGGGGSVQASGTVGSGGAGGGGAGGANVYGVSGTANTGGGAGGTGQASGTASNGGSGIVIIRYAV